MCVWGEGYRRFLRGGEGSNSKSFSPLILRHRPINYILKGRGLGCRILIFSHSPFPNSALWLEGVEFLFSIHSSTPPPPPPPHTHTFKWNGPYTNSKCERSYFEFNNTGSLTTTISLYI